MVAPSWLFQVTTSAVPRVQSRTWAVKSVSLRGEK